MTGRAAALAFGALYEDTGFDRINLDVTLGYKAPLDYRSVRGGEVTDIRE